MIYCSIYLLALVGAAPTEPVHFDTQIVPVLTKAGCNAGACHGAAVGRGGFKLSLYGGDPAERDRAMQRIDDQGCRFYLFGQLENGAVDLGEIGKWGGWCIRVTLYSILHMYPKIGP